LVLEVLRGERELGEIALEHQINPNQLRTWKAAFLEKAPMVFEEDKADKEAARREEEAAAEKAAMLKTIGQLTLERDFLMQQAHERNKGAPFRKR
jgi:transposase-like protein